MKLQVYASMLYKCANECHRGLFIDHEVVVVYYFGTESKKTDFMGLYVCVSRILFPSLIVSVAPLSDVTMSCSELIHAGLNHFSPQ